MISNCNLFSNSVDCDSDNEFVCENGECIDLDWKCDGEKDCYDGSDESKRLCGHSVVHMNILNESFYLA